MQQKLNKTQWFIKEKVGIYELVEQKIGGITCSFLF